MLQPPYKVELDNPKKTIMVQVLKATAAISVLEDYKTLGKLNLRELSMIGDDDEEDKATTSKKATAAATEKSKISATNRKTSPSSGAALTPTDKADGASPKIDETDSAKIASNSDQTDSKS